jgi:y4mF family transcriptional regulator
MPIRTPADLGAAIRERRKQLGLDQATLAQRIGASRQWIIGIERGHARAELGLVLRALDALDLHVSAGAADTGQRVSAPDRVAGPDLDAIVAAARQK